MGRAGVDIGLHEVGGSASAAEGRIVAVGDIDVDWHICNGAVVSDLDVSIDRTRGHREVVREHHSHCEVALQAAEGYGVGASGESEQGGRRAGGDSTGRPS